jgi:hypothetical protein
MDALHDPLVGCAGAMDWAFGCSAIISPRRSNPLSSMVAQIGFVLPKMGI